MGMGCNDRAPMSPNSSAHQHTRAHQLTSVPKPISCSMLYGVHVLTKLLPWLLLRCRTSSQGQE